MEKILIGAAVFLAAVYLGWRIFRHGASPGCGGGCSGCPLYGECEKKDKQD